MMTTDWILRSILKTNIYIYPYIYIYQSEDGQHGVKCNGKRLLRSSKEDQKYFTVLIIPQGQLFGQM